MDLKQFQAGGDDEQLEYEDQVEFELPEGWTPEDYDAACEEVMLEAMLDGRLPFPEEAFGELVELGHEIGLVTQQEDGSLVLSRDIPLINETANNTALALGFDPDALVESPGLQLSQLALSSNAMAGKFAKIAWTGNQAAKQSTRKTLKRAFAKGMGRLKTGARAKWEGAKQAVREAPGEVIVGGLTGSALGGAIAGHMRERRGYRKGKASIVANAEARNKK